MAESAIQLLESLIGRNIPTVTGRPNRVLAVEGDRVLVRTARSPAGQKIPITWVQDALDKLHRDGSVEISVDSVGYRSAFIGAALSQVPGTEVDRAPSPPLVRLHGVG
jgi:hypothetical protein